MNAKEAIVTILSGQTIDDVERRCGMVADQGFESLATKLEEKSQFILTEHRHRILDEATEGLKNCDYPSVILHGSYGSGKTVLMDSIKQLCDGPQKLGTEDIEFPRITYGDDNISCMTISLERYDTPNKLLSTLFMTLLELPDSPPEEDYIEAYKEHRDNISMAALEDRLTPDQWERIAEKHDHPESVTDIAIVAKELPVGEAFSVLTWLTSAYRDETGHYPGIYLDEFEQAFRSGISNQKDDRLRLLVQKFLRKAVTGFREFDLPPFILFANTLTLDDMRETLAIERDFTDRIDQSLSFGVDPTVEESKELLVELYRFYALPVLADAEKPYHTWHDQLSSASSGDDAYSYPFTSDALNRIIDPLQKSEDGTIIRGFRDFKLLFTEYLDRWDGTNGQVIEVEFLYLNGDAVREDLRDRVERVRLELIPGKESIESSIGNEFEVLELRLVRVLEEIAQEAVLNRERQPAYFSKADIESCGERAEVDLSEMDFETLFESVSSVAFFEIEDGNLVVGQNELLDVAAPDQEQSRTELLREINTTLGDGGRKLAELQILECWNQYYENHQSSVPSFEYKNTHIAFDIQGELKYTGAVYLCIESIPDTIQAIEPGTALSLVICLSDTDDNEEYPVKFEVSELGVRANSLMNSLQKSLNNNLIHPIFDDEPRAEYLEDIKQAFPGISKADAYKFALRATLLRDSYHDQLPREIRQMTFPNQIFEPSVLESELTGLYDSYTAKQLGYSSDSYAGHELLTLAYAIEHLEKLGSMDYTEPHLPSIKIPRFGGVSRRPEVGRDLKETLDKFEENELFMDNRDIRENYTQQMEAQIGRIQEKVKESGGNGVELSDLFVLLFGTKSIDSVAKAQVFLIAEIGDYNGHWVLESGTKLVSVEDSLTARRNTVKSALRVSLKTQLINAVNTDKIDIEDIRKTKEAYGTADSATPAELDEFESEYVVEKSDMEHDELDRRMQDLAGDEVVGSTDIGPYLTQLRPLGDMDSDQLYLIYPRLTHLVSQLENAKEVLYAKDNLNQLKSKYETLSGSEISVESVIIDPPATVEEFFSDHTEDQLGVDTDIEGNVAKVLNDDLLLPDTIQVLAEQRNSLVPNVDEYDPADDLETLQGSIETVEASLERELEGWEIKLESAQQELSSLLKRVDEPEGWDRRANSVLEELEEELQVDAEYVAAESVTRYWIRWIAAKNALEGLAVDPGNVQAILDELGIEKEVDEVLRTTDVDVAEGLARLPDSIFNQIIKALEVEDELDSDEGENSINRLKLALVRERVLRPNGDKEEV